MFCRLRLVLPCRERQKNGIIRKIYARKNLPQSGDILPESGDASPCTQIQREKSKKKIERKKKKGKMASSPGKRGRLCPRVLRECFIWCEGSKNELKRRYCAGHNYTTAFIFSGRFFYRAFRENHKICGFDAPLRFGDCSPKKKEAIFHGTNV